MTATHFWEPTGFEGRPRYDGANINTFIGFKNFMTLAEESVLQHFRDQGFGPQRLFTTYGLGLEVVDSSTRLINTLHADDLVHGTVESTPVKSGQGLTCKVDLVTTRDGVDVPVLAGRLKVALVTEVDGVPAEPVPAELRSLVVADVAAAGKARPVLEVPAGVTAEKALAPANGFVWDWEIPYFYCHWYTRLQSSGYVRLLEEATDRYLAHAGLPITGLLAQRDWIPVVSKARVQMHGDAYMGEVLHITYRVDDVIKDIVWTATMECHVRRGDQLVNVATCTIMHGYVPARGPEAFAGIVTLDEATQRALLGGAA
ncbi:thioesterase family protein [Kitasatospora sp. P5_F3]